MQTFRWVIIALVVVLGILFLYPTYKWYFVVPEKDKQLMNLSLEERERLPEQEKIKLTELKRLRNSTVMNLGLDLSGGVYMVLEVDTNDLYDWLLASYGDPEVVEKRFEEEKKQVSQMVLRILRNRMDKFGVAEPVIRLDAEGRIVVELPGISSPEYAMEALTKAGKLEFMLVDEKAMENVPPAYLTRVEGTELIASYDYLTNIKIPEDSAPYGYWINDQYGIPKLVGYIILKNRVELSGEHIQMAYVDRDELGNPRVAFRLDPQGAEMFAKITRENVGTRLAIVLDGRVRSAPVIREEIPSGSGVITGNFTEEEASFLASVLQSGSLPVRLQPIEIRQIGPSLGGESIRKGVISALIGVLLVFVFAILYYRLSGFITTIALSLNLFLLLALLSALRATLTLSGIAGIALTIGMAIDSNVLIFERVKEEIRKNRPLDSALDIGFKNAWRAILDSNVTTLFASVPLAMLGYGPIKGFGVTLTIGIIVSLFTAVFVVRTLLDFIINTVKIKNVNVLF